MAKYTLVIGAGVAGLSVAFALTRRGRRVLIVERGQAGAESTWAGGGILSPLLPWQYSEAVISLALPAMQMWTAWAEAIEAHSGMTIEYRQCGMKAYAVPDLDFALSWCSTHGLPATALESNEPAVWLPEAAQVRNPRLVDALLAAISRTGGQVLESVRDFALLPQGGRVEAIQIDDARYGVEQVVVSTGAWAGLPIPSTDMTPVPNIRPVKGQMLLFKLPANMLETILYRQGTYVIPRQDGHVLVGSTLEYAGFDKTIDAETARQLHAAATVMLPALGNFSPIRHWSGLRPGSPDNIPVIGRHPDFDNVFVNSGHYRYGLTMAPASAELLADLMENKMPELDPSPYSWEAALERRWANHP